MLLLLLSACDLVGDLGDLGKALGACADSVDDLAGQDALPAECRDGVLAALPDPTSGLAGTLTIAGEDLDDAGQRVLYVYGLDAGLSPFTLDDYADATVTMVAGGTPGPVETVVAPAEGDDLFSLSFVTDYSASMTDGDLDLLADIHGDLIDTLPFDFEAEFLAFSDTVIERQPFTEDHDAMHAGAARDAGVERGSTALYDGAGTGAADLVGRRPVRLLICATDGLENASTTYDAESVHAPVAESRAAVLMIGTLFADVDEMMSIAGDRGAFLYAASFDGVREGFDRYSEAVANTVAITVPGDATEVRIALGTATATWEE